ncbi:stage III sporulation protein AG [Bacillus sp. CGMCC 1.16607]|uniref:stage III sporulation protein AG n=1 Tax=Bacillus sp. CGMCC 1.16607 TaxID=3351842 RepID=UPI00363D4932
MDLKGPFSRLRNLLPTKEKQGKKNVKMQYLLLVGLFGAVIMLANNILFSDKSSLDQSISTFQNQANSEKDVEVFGPKSSGGGKTSISDYERAYEAQLKDALEQMLGVDKVTVIVNVDATDKKVLEKNVTTQSQTTNETDREGGKRKVEDASINEQLVIVREGEKEGPILLETKKPKIRGVLVVAQGAENIQVKKWIIEAVTRVLDVGSHRVAVMPKKN